MQRLPAYDDALKGKRPGVVVVPEWWGLNDFTRKKAEQLAGLGYVALAADIYGNGAVAKDPKEAARLAELRGNKPLLRARAAKRSWQYMQDFFKEIFAVKGRD